MDNCGYLVFANTSTERRQATALAYSLLARNPDSLISVCVPDLNVFESEYEEPFDNIIEYPYDKHDITRLNEWQAIYMTPYQHNIVMSAGTLVHCAMDNTWEYLIDNHDLCFPTTVKNFKNHDILEDPRFANYKLNSLHSVYSNMYYFRKDAQQALDYFKLSDPYYRNYAELYEEILVKHHIPDTFDPNMSASISVTHMNILEDVRPLYTGLFTYTDMIGSRFYFSRDIPNWTDYLNVWPSTDGKIKIQNYAINSVLSYHEADFLTNDIFHEQQTYYRQQTQ